MDDDTQSPAMENAVSMAGLCGPDNRTRAGARARILVVDDDLALLRALGRGLKDCGEVLTATTAPDALELLAESSATAVLSDLNLGTDSPDGVWLLREVRDLQPDTRRVLLTGAPDERARDALAAGVVHRLLLKPVAMDLLRDAVQGFARSPG